MAELKTQKNDQSVEEFINSIADEHKRQDCRTVLEMMQRLTQAKPMMWGSTTLEKIIQKTVEKANNLNQENAV